MTKKLIITGYGVEFRHSTGRFEVQYHIELDDSGEGRRQWGKGLVFLFWEDEVENADYTIMSDPQGIREKVAKRRNRPPFRRNNQNLGIKIIGIKKTIRFSKLRVELSYKIENLDNGVLDLPNHSWVWEDQLPAYVADPECLSPFFREGPCLCCNDGTGLPEGAKCEMCDRVGLSATPKSTEENDEMTKKDNRTPLNRQDAYQQMMKVRWRLVEKDLAEEIQSVENELGLAIRCGRSSGEVNATKHPKLFSYRETFEWYFKERRFNITFFDRDDVPHAEISWR